MDRLFIAIDIPMDIKRKFVEIIKNLDYIKAKTVPLENIHITIKFIGETTKTNEIIQSLKEISFHQFDLEVEGVGLFGSIYYPKVFWVGMKENRDLFSLFNKIEDNLAKIGIPKDERDFSPHITLARFKAKTDARKLEDILERFNIYFGGFSVKEFVLYKSMLSHPNPKYYPIESFNLI